MDLEKRPEPEGCLVVAVRLPVRIVALVLVVPVRLAWDALTVVGRVLYERVLVPLARVLIVAPARWLYAYLLTPLGHAIAVLGKGVGVVLRWLAMAVFVWPWVALWRYVLVPVGLALAWLARVLIAIPAGWLYTYLLTPLGRALAWLVRVLVVVPCAWFYVSLLTPLGHALRWTLLALGRAVGTLFRWVFVVPVLTLWRWVLVPAGRALGVLARETGAALVHAWRVAGYVSLAVGRFLGRVLRWLLVDPARWIYRHLLTPVGHVVRDQVWRPVVRVAREVRASVRQARAELRRALFGTPSPAETRPEPQVRALREPEAAHTRSLGKSTTALTKD
ncbi:hypothetical protein OKJ48_06610 [Streptomyces kunmingensis]|uniref:Integral membrane protein n=1 Tax=Streptomyces kunmingensis TaxID=68225 RepID=A0ABU6C6G7_9ACTN|nr:hypothetical protein [Streptomyces kunmingensis]MEB3959925.1 hypothetical protein [Streptomyces kunmingensis]